MKKIFNIVIKVLILIGFVYVIRNYISSNNWTDIGASISKDDLYSRWYLIPVIIILMPVNWLLESKKWHVVMNNYSEINYGSAVISILCGITCGLLTPARVGEFMGRLLLVKSEDKKVSVYASFLCSISQNIITLILGLVSVVVFITYINAIDIAVSTLLIVNVIIISIGLCLYYNHKTLISYLSFTTFYKKHLLFISEHKVSLGLLNRVLLLSLLRYLVYGTQYVLILCFLGLSSALYYNVVAIGTIFLIQSTIPLPPMMGLLARGEIAVFVLGVLSYSTPIGLLAAGLIWVINLICPALLGLAYLMKMNIWKSVRQ